MSQHDPIEAMDYEHEQGEAQANLQRRRDQIRADDLKWLMSDKRGRRIVWRFLEETGVYRSSFRTDGLSMAFEEGQRNVGLKLMSEALEQSPDKYALMVAEKGTT